MITPLNNRFSLDVFYEDDSRIQKNHASDNLSVVRHLVHSTLKQLPSPKNASLKRERKLCSYDADLLSAAIGLILS